MRLRRVPEGSVALRRSQDALGIERGAHVTGAGIESGSPHLLVGDAMGAYDRDARVFAVQPLDLCQRRGLDVEHGDAGVAPWNVETQLLEGIGNTYRVVLMT